LLLVTAGKDRKDFHSLKLFCIFIFALLFGVIGGIFGVGMRRGILRYGENIESNLAGFSFFLITFYKGRSSETPMLLQTPNNSTPGFF